MKTLLAFFVSALTLNAQWSACNTAGKAVGVRYDAGDVVTLPLPGPKSRPTYVAFLTTSAINGNLVGKTITATLAITAPAGTTYSVGYGAGPATVRLYFTTVPGAFNLNNSNNQTLLYWWQDVAYVTCDTLDNGGNVTLTATLAPTAVWSAAHGEPSSSNASAFMSAASNVAQIGFALAGSQFFDTGVDCSPVGATLHVTTFSVQ